MPRSDQARLRDITEAATRIRDRVRGLTHEGLAANDVLLRAVLFDLAVIGEAAKGVSKSAQANYPTVPWEDMAGMRDVVVHQYFGIDTRIVWNVATTYIHELLQKLGDQA